MFSVRTIEFQRHIEYIGSTGKTSFDVVVSSVSVDRTMHAREGDFLHRVLPQWPEAQSDPWSKSLLLLLLVIPGLLLCIVRMISIFQAERSGDSLAVLFTTLRGHEGVAVMIILVFAAIAIYISGALLLLIEFFKVDGAFGSTDALSIALAAVLAGAITSVIGTVYHASMLANRVFSRKMYRLVRLTVFDTVQEFALLVVEVMCIVMTALLLHHVRSAASESGIDDWTSTRRLMEARFFSSVCLVLAAISAASTASIGPAPRMLSSAYLGVLFGMHVAPPLRRSGTLDATACRIPTWNHQ